jgi:hypothetical protein
MFYLFRILTDCIFSVFVVTNLVAFIWRIIWDTQDIYVEVSSLQSKLINATLSLIISYAIIFYIRYTQIADIISTDNSKSLQRASVWKNYKIKFLIILFAFANVNLWRGVWNFTIYYSQESVLGIFTIGISSFFTLIYMQRVCVMTSVPYTINEDSKETIYHIVCASNKNYDSLFNFDRSSNNIPDMWIMGYYILLEHLADLFTVQTWRSLWFFQDKYLFPDNQTNSAYASLSSGIFIYLILYIFNQKINDLMVNYAQNYEHHSKEETRTIKETFLKHIIHKVIYKLLIYLVFIMSFVSTVNCWRGLWMLQLEYCYPKIFSSKLTNQIILNAIYCFVFLAFLCSINLTSTLLPRSNCKDSYFTIQDNVLVKQNTLCAVFQQKVSTTYLFIFYEKVNNQ